MNSLYFCLLSVNGLNKIHFCILYMMRSRGIKKYVHTISYLCALPRNLYAAAESGFNLMASSQSRIAALTLFCFNSIFALFAYNMADPAQKWVFVLFFTIYFVIFQYTLFSLYVVIILRWNIRNKFQETTKKRKEAFALLTSIYKRMTPTNNHMKYQFPFHLKILNEYV